jgi:hypothetical protein
MEIIYLKFLYIDLKSLISLVHYIIFRFRLYIFIYSYILSILALLTDENEILMVYKIMHTVIILLPMTETQ